jgi:hypothetical protein
VAWQDELISLDITDNGGGLGAPARSSGRVSWGAGLGARQ